MVPRANMDRGIGGFGREPDGASCPSLDSFPARKQTPGEMSVGNSVQQGQTAAALVAFASARSPPISLALLGTASVA